MALLPAATGRAERIARTPNMTGHPIAYDFAPFLAALGDNWYDDDAQLQSLLNRYGSSVDHQENSAWGARCAGELRELAEESALPENAPGLRHFDATGHRVDDVLLPRSTLAALAAVAGDARLGAVHGDPFEFYSRIYLYAQNGEAGVACSLACTDGLVRVLDALGDRPEHAEAADRVRQSSRERVWHGAQFVTEIQGGSDVQANAVLATADGGAYRLRGQKWFCSNINADCFLVTARPSDASAVGLFLVPARAPDGRRNGYTIDRLKDKLGTRELATAEVSFDGALAWPVGDLERGVPNLLRYVLTPSRFACVLFAASALRRAERIVSAYVNFRIAFGRRIGDYAPVRAVVAEIRRERERTLALTFELLRLWMRAEAEPVGDDAAAFRILLSLAKPTVTRRASLLLHDAMMLLGGNGIEERFSPLPRLYRDMAIMETWEGPHFVLLAQARRDLKRSGMAPAALVSHLLSGNEPALAVALEKATRGEDAETPGAFARAAFELVDAVADRVRL